MSYVRLKVSIVFYDRKGSDQPLHYYCINTALEDSGTVVERRTSRTTGPEFESRDERDLPLGFFHTSTG